MSKQNKKRLLDHPIAGGLLLTLLGLLFMQIVGIISIFLKSFGFDQGTFNVLESCSTIILALCFWAIYRNMFHNQMNLTFNLENLRKGLIIVAVPTIVFGGGNLLGLFDSKIANPLVALFLGLCPGVLEEILFRGLILSNAMRTVRKYKTILIILIVSALNFGLFHFTNLAVGAGLGSTITQVVYATGLGMVFGAAYLRTGSLLPCIISHAVIDITAYLEYSLQTNQVLSADSIAWDSIAIGIGFIFLGLYFIRPSKQSEIIGIWKRKWNLTPPALPQMA